LIEIDDRKKILHKGDRVLDCGAAPGSWMQVATKRVGPKGMVVGIDLQAIKHRFAEPNVRFIQGDFTATPPGTLLDLAGDASRRFDVILSDMAPNTTGDPFSDHHSSIRLCNALLDVCPALLRHSEETIGRAAKKSSKSGGGGASGGGSLIMKVFEGEAYADLLKRTATMFETVKGFKPKASRSESTEMYIVASGYRNPMNDAADGAGTAADRHSGPAKSKPAGGWS
jgi:23S rRNA (uridine2552-2'-O)-methyltransferase